MLEQKIERVYLLGYLLSYMFIIWVTSVMSFLIIQLPAGDFVDNLAVQTARSRREVDEDEDRLNNLRQQLCVKNVLAVLHDETPVTPVNQPRL